MGRQSTLDCSARPTDNQSMEIAGRVQNGVVVFEGETTLPEGTEVNVVPRAKPVIQVAKRRRRVVLPLVRSGRPRSVRLTGERIADLLEEEDLSARH